MFLLLLKKSYSSLSEPKYFNKFHWNDKYPGIILTYLTVLLSRGVLFAQVYGSKFAKKGSWQQQTFEHFEGDRQLIAMMS